MIVYLPLNLKQIEENFRDYHWPRPGCCGQCNHSKVWGDGYVPMIFENFQNALKIRRYRCPCCGCIMRIRPLGFFKGIQSATTTIRNALATRLRKGHWPRGGVADRARHWLRALKRNAMVFLGKAALADLIVAFDKLVDSGRVPVTRSI